ncbi:DUF6993 domain-containing protein [Microbacterium sp.]|uniref:DUF6993 domain-containing protein n=1 Tax=Microbacterium sp. TaxID=51671 RepID=UPI003A844E70
MHPRRWLPVVAVCQVTALAALVACTPTAEPSPTATTMPSPSATATADPVEFFPNGSATDNLPLFRHLVKQVAESSDTVAGRAYIDALVEAGFDKDAMQLTPDQTSVGHAVDAIQFSVLWDGECLVGQVGPSTPEPTAIVLPELPEGGCLVGQTRPIDW